jgi:hypothetical protein
MYDNRETKKNPKQPDFKCKRYKEGCEGVIWPPKGGNGVKPAPKPAPVMEHTMGRLPNDDPSGFDELVEKYGECLDAVTELANARKMTLDPQSYAAMVATVYIQRVKANV